MIYDIKHVTTYSYATQVSFARCALRLRPLTDTGQSLQSHSVDIRPRPSERNTRVDFFGTEVETVLIDVPHKLLKIESRSRVSVDRTPPARDADSPAWERVREAAFDAAKFEAASPVNYVFASSLTPIQPAISAYAQESFAPGRGVLSGSVELMHRIYTDFKYDPKATVISTPLAEVFEKRHGVCQDFAHVMIAGMRGIGLPAAYVSGYLRTIPPPGQKRLEGADASHAWVAVWCGDALGWVGLDPTNDILVANHHIELAVGRDFADVSPVDGMIVGSRRQKLGVAVDVLLVE